MGNPGLNESILRHGQQSEYVNDKPLVSVRGLYESDESVIRRPLLKS